MDFLQCGRCLQVYHHISSFVRHKRNCKNPSQDLEVYHDHLQPADGLNDISKRLQKGDELPGHTALTAMSSPAKRGCMLGLKRGRVYEVSNEETSSIASNSITESREQTTVGRIAPLPMLPLTITQEHCYAMNNSKWWLLQIETENPLSHIFMSRTRFMEFRYHRFSLTEQEFNCVLQCATKFTCINALHTHYNKCHNLNVAVLVKEVVISLGRIMTGHKRSSDLSDSLEQPLKSEISTDAVAEECDKQTQCEAVCCLFPNCRQIFPSTLFLQMHLLNIHQQRTEFVCELQSSDPSVCSVCGVTEPRGPVELEQHYEVVHFRSAAIDSFACEHCRQTDTSAMSIGKHVVDTHQGKCPVCCVRLASLNSDSPEFAHHALSHFVRTGGCSKQLKCSLCSAALPEELVPFHFTDSRWRCVGLMDEKLSTIAGGRYPSTTTWTGLSELVSDDTEGLPDRSEISRVPKWLGILKQLLIRAECSQEPNAQTSSARNLVLAANMKQGAEFVKHVTETFADVAKTFGRTVNDACCIENKALEIPPVRSYLINKLTRESISADCNALTFLGSDEPQLSELQDFPTLSDNTGAALRQCGTDAGLDIHETSSVAATVAPAVTSTYEDSVETSGMRSNGPMMLCTVASDHVDTSMASLLAPVKPVVVSAVSSGHMGTSIRSTTVTSVFLSNANVTSSSSRSLITGVKVVPRNLRTVRGSEDLTCFICWKQYDNSAHIVWHYNMMHKSWVERSSNCARLPSVDHNHYTSNTHEEPESQSNEGFGSYEKHMQAVHDRELHFKCLLTACSKCFSIVDEYRYHSEQMSHIPNSLSCCHICDVVVFTKKELERHQSTIEHSENKLKEAGGWQCPLCRQNFGRLAMQTHLASDRHYYPCDMCQHVSISKKQLHCHKSCEHRKTSQICEVCGKVIQSMTGLWKHKVTVHQLINPRECKYCKKVFPFKSKLRYHLREHEPDKWFACTVSKHCRSVFRSKRRLEWHEKAHMALICDVCGKQFSRREYLRSHRVTSHTKRFTYWCDVCNKGFAQKERLKRHTYMASCMASHKTKLMETAAPVNIACASPHVKAGPAKSQAL
ncbi:PREDICTED: uncharacterized protein LOC106808007 isoform X2 [Priapulus caudatus]|uniref:Uncharacterized protein LOC106808007 isoform X2 n=1 Tax=Priapulus caudatus TaxID=37621 RepID=A0ABM1E1G2_PRICU|nr:PREDICTED: uncharacterized protein LOC106808007 isoform X2 [Priapulus caudatus]